MFRRVTGGLGMATVAANAVFAAVTGTSVACGLGIHQDRRAGDAANRLQAEIRRRRRRRLVRAGDADPAEPAASILYGIIAETSIGDLLLAGIIPGILLAGGYSFTIWLMATRFKGSVLIDETKADVRGAPLMGGREIWDKAGPISLLIVLVLGGLYGGIFTATECAGVGAGGALLIALFKRTLTWRSFWHILIESGHLTAAISFLIISANLYARMISVTGIPNAMEAYVNHLGIGFYGLLAIYLGVVLFLGTLLNSASTTLIAVPLFIPLLTPMGADPIWLGVITIVAVEIGLLTPPLGITVFVVHSTLADPNISVDDIFRGALPFLLTTLTFLIILVLVPELSLVLT